MKQIKKFTALLLCIAISAALTLCGCRDSARNTQGTASGETTVQTNADEQAQSTAASKDQGYEQTLAFIQQIKCGWNLGNTLDATGIWGKDELPKNYSVNDIETGWGNPSTTKDMITTVKNTGFNAVRIPVSWYRFVTEKDGKYTIDKKWLKRVKEVVDYAYTQDMFVIVDMHHDDKDWLDISAEGDKWNAVKEEYSQLWEQIAVYFKDYSEKLLFEGANEIVRCTGKDDDGNKQYDWWGDETGFSRINELYEVFVETVRKTGGNNEKRYLVIPTYGAQWYQHQLDAIVIPNGDERVIVDMHWYQAEPDAENITQTFQNAYDSASYFKIPIIIGECGIGKDKGDEQRIEWAKTYVRIASNFGFRCFIWDDGGNYSLLDRKTLKWNSDEFVKSIISNAIKLEQDSTLQ